MSTSHCFNCHQPLSPTVYISTGLLGTYEECEWCHRGEKRPELPEIITDTFAKPEGTDLDAILDRLFLMGEPDALEPAKANAR